MVQTLKNLKSIRSKILLNILKAWNVIVQQLEVNLTSSVCMVGHTERPHMLSTPIRHPFTQRVCQACTLYNTAWDRMHAVWPVNKDVRQISVPLYSLLFTISETALHRGDSENVCYKGRVATKSARILRVLLRPQLLKWIVAVQSEWLKACRVKNKTNKN